MKENVKNILIDGKEVSLIEKKDGYCAWFIERPNLISEGENIEKVLKNLTDLLLYIEISESLTS